MNNRKTLTALLVLGLFLSCNKDNESPKGDESISESSGFVLEAEADAEDLGLGIMRSGLFEFEIERTPNGSKIQWGDNKADAYVTQAFFRRRSDPSILGYAQIDWRIDKVEGRKVKLRFYSKDLKVEKIGAGYNPSRPVYLNIDPRAVSASHSNTADWLVGGVMGVPATAVNKRTGEVRITPLNEVSYGATKIDGHEGKFRTPRINVPLVGRYASIYPDTDSNPPKPMRGRLFSWQFETTGILLRVRFRNETNKRIDNGSIELKHLDNPAKSLAGTATIGFSSADVPSPAPGRTRPKVKVSADAQVDPNPVLKVSQGHTASNGGSHEDGDKFHLLWAIARDGKETPAGITLWLSRPGESRPEQLKRTTTSTTHPDYLYKTKGSLKNGATYEIYVKSEK